MWVWRTVQRTTRADEEPWAELPVLVRPVGLTHAVVQAHAHATGPLSPAVTVALWGTSLSPTAPASAWRRIAEAVLTDTDPSAFLGVNDLIDLFPYRWLRASADGGPGTCALLVAFDGDVSESPCR